jgi:hypothetical protein
MRRCLLPVLALALLAGCGTDTVDQASGPADGSPGGAPTPSATVAVEPPAGYRFVGIDHAAIAVPDTWGTNEVRCGTPQADTVVVDQGVVCMALVPRPAGVESVDIRRGNADIDTDFHESFEIDGVRAERRATTCHDRRGIVVCTGAVRIPSLNVVFAAESSTDEASVEQILSQIRIVPQLIAVPEYRTRQTRLQEDSEKAYRDALREAGLEAKVETRRISGMERGHVLEVKPESGTMLRPGETVTMTVSAAPRNAGDTISVGMNSDDAQGDYGQDLDDAAIRSGTAKLQVQLGGRVWAYYAQDRDFKLVGELDGDALALDSSKTGPNVGRTWKAVHLGVSKLTLVYVVDGKRYELGTVRVEVTRSKPASTDDE